ncbi:uncharacterized protein SPSK_06701 [Sporothrix schenckii 1099-18]|uniref:Uncharacterized protein n=1 Tax=Sporothrix schenckii 1099-18 TaxID=1397361 RepID=A0A0F2MJ44_SPOSC|nr:uncharacterized protein SPSK_06701 [Sporothrix schenckii 1099-18]KJR89074.1 hypothetical protein SPSK_06701 [Sporothrix schenckii 1099-18]
MVEAASDCSNATPTAVQPTHAPAVASLLVPSLVSSSPTAGLYDNKAVVNGKSHTRLQGAEVGVRTASLAMLHSSLLPLPCTTTFLGLPISLVLSTPLVTAFLLLFSSCKLTPHRNLHPLKTKKTHAFFSGLVSIAPVPLMLFVWKAKLSLVVAALHNIP